MRHIIVHEYHRLDLESIWQTAREDVPILVPLLEANFGRFVDIEDEGNP